MKRFLSIGNRIKELRGKKSQKDFAEKVNIPFRTYQRYESGNVAPKGSALEKIAQNCNVSVEYILTGELSPAEEEQSMKIVAEFFRILNKLPEKAQRDLLKTAKEKERLIDLIEKYERRKLKDAG
jgi:transcriptional regulator with XRE-family HTH domain